MHQVTWAGEICMRHLISVFSVPRLAYRYRPPYLLSYLPCNIINSCNLEQLSQSDRVQNNIQILFPFNQARPAKLTSSVNSLASSLLRHSAGQETRHCLHSPSASCRTGSHGPSADSIVGDHADQVPYIPVLATEEQRRPVYCILYCRPAWARDQAKEMAVVPSWISAEVVSRPSGLAASSSLVSIVSARGSFLEYPPLLATTTRSSLLSMRSPYLPPGYVAKSILYRS